MTEAPRLRICIVYDCLFPYTLGGAERWCRNLAERLAAEGHSVTYLTLRQWDVGERGEIPGVEVVAVGPRLSLYGPDGARRILPPLIFGLGVFWHLLRRGRAYDVLHTASFPYFSLLAAALLQTGQHDAARGVAVNQLQQRRDVFHARLANFERNARRGMLDDRVRREAANHGTSPVARREPLWYPPVRGRKGRR